MAEKVQQQQLTDILTPHPHDVLSGRGNFVNNHAGNVNFRYLVKMHQEDYVSCPRDKKVEYAQMIVEAIGNVDPPGRFLKQDIRTNLWQAVGDEKSILKTRQALREGAPKITQKKLPNNCTPPQQHSSAELTKNSEDSEQAKNAPPDSLQSLIKVCSNTSESDEYPIPEADNDVSCPRDKKVEYPQMIVEAIGNVDPPGRFLKQDTPISLWQAIVDEKSILKTRQALREGAPKMTQKKLPKNCTPPEVCSNTSKSVEYPIPEEDNDVSCPKDKNMEYAQMIEAIGSADPSKQDTHIRLWQAIVDDKSILKTRQAVREGAPKMTQKKLPNNCTPPQQHPGAEETKDSEYSEQAKNASPHSLQSLIEVFSNTSESDEYPIPEEDDRSSSGSIHLENLDDDDMKNNVEEATPWKAECPSNARSCLSSGNMSISFGELHYENSLCSMMHSMSFSGYDKKLGSIIQNMSDSDSWANLSQSLYTQVG